MTTKAIQVIRGSTKAIPFSYVDEKGNRKTLVGAKAYVEVRADAKADPVVHLASDITLLVPDANNITWRLGITFNDQVADKGGGVVTFAPADFAGRVALGDSDPWLWELWVTDADGSRNVIISSSTLGLYPETATIPTPHA